MSPKTTPSAARVSSPARERSVVTRRCPAANGSWPLCYHPLRLVHALRASSLAVANVLAALTTTVLFKILLFAYSLSGAEGVSSALVTWPRILLCLGWDVVSAAVVATIVSLIATPFAGRLPRLAMTVSAIVQAIYAVFLVISYHVAVIVGAPLDKAAIDLLFLYNATPGRTGSLVAESVLPYVTRAVVVEGATA